MSTLGIVLGQVVGGVVGGVVGSLIPVVGTAGGAALGSMIGGTIGSLVGRTKAGPAKLEKTESAYGAALPIVYGTSLSPGVLLWASDVRQVQPDSLEHPTTVTGTGPIGSLIADQSLVNVCDFAIAICRGPVARVNKVWADGHLIVDNSGDSNLTSPTRYRDRMTVYLGTESQSADPTIEAMETIAPAYRGVAYVVFKDWPLDDWEGRIPEFRFEVSEADAAYYKVSTVAMGSATDGDNHVFSETTPHLYALSGSTLSKVNREAHDLSAQVNAHDLQDITLGSETFGKLVLGTADGTGEFLYLLVTKPDGGGDESYILRVGARQLNFRTSNYASRVATASERDGIVLNGKLYTADNYGAKIRAYDATTLVRQWTRSGPDANARPGNFIVDNRGRLWLISWLDSDSDKFFLTRCSAGGEVAHFTYTGQGRCKALAYDPAYNQPHGILLAGGGDGTNRKLVALTSALFAAPTVAATLSNVSGSSARSCFVSQRRVYNHRIWVRNVGDDTIYQVLIASNGALSINSTYAVSSFGLSSVSGLGADRPANALWSEDGTNLKELHLDRFTAGNSTLDDVVTDICGLAGLSASDILVSDLASEAVRGYTIESQCSARTALEPLLIASQVDPRERDYKLEFLRRGGAAVVDIPEADLGAHDYGSEAPEKIEEERVEETALPRAVKITYISRERDYAEASQTVQRPADIVETREELSISLPLVMTDDAARRLAAAILYAAWVARHLISFSLGPRYMRLDPADVITTTVSGVAYKARIASREEGAQGLLRCQATLEEPTVYTQTLTGAAAPYAASAIALPVPTEAALLDIPLLRDSDDDEGFYLAVCPAGSGLWPGATVYRSLEGGIFSPFLSLTGAVPMGICLAALPVGDSYVYDTSYTVRVRLLYGTLSTLSEEDFLNDGNLAAVGNEEKGWEILQFRTATLVSTGVYDLTGWLRGRRGTEWAQSGHATGDLFVLLDLTKIRRVVPQSAELDLQRVYRVVTAGQSPEGAPSLYHTNRGVGLECYSPVDLLGKKTTSRGATPAAWGISWQRRSRVGGGWQDFTEIPLGETTESYEVDILSAPGGSVLSTLSCGSPPSLSGVNLAIDGPSQTLIRASGSFFADGWAAGQLIEMAGFTNPENNGVFRVSFVDTTALDIDTEGHPLLVTEASASGRTATALNPGVRHVTPSSPIYVAVYQLSATRGRGYGAVATLSSS